MSLTACTTADKNFVDINNKRIQVEVVDTAEAQYRGLSNRENLCQDCGMLFVFGDKQMRTFVMRDMKFSLDIIWIDEDKIIKIDKSLLPEGPDPINKYSSKEPVDYVLEVEAGFADKNNIKIGDEVNF